MNNKLILIFILILCFSVIVGCNNMEPEVAYEVLTYDELDADFQENLLQLIEEIEETEKHNRESSTIHLYLGKEIYHVLIPNTNKSYEVVYLGEDDVYGDGILYRYKIIEAESDNILDNVKLIKVENHYGRIRGARMNN